MHSQQGQVVEDHKVFFQQNFRDGMSEFQMLEYGIPRRGILFKKEEVLPEHIDDIGDYICSFTVDHDTARRRNPIQGMIMTGTQDLCIKYMSLILRRVHMRRREIRCKTVYELEALCRDRDEFHFYSSELSLLGVHSFPFFSHGIVKDKPDMMMTPFHQMLNKRINNGLPTILVCHTDLMSLINAYSAFPSYMKEDLQNYFLIKEFKQQRVSQQ